MGRKQDQREIYAALGIPNVYFDLDSNGFAKRVGMAAAFEALLALDDNRNSRIDAVGNSLLAWHDSNRNEVSDAGELTTTTDSDVTSISLAGGVPSLRDRQSGRESNGTLAVADYARGGGRTGQLIAFAFTSDQTNTWFVLPNGFAYDPDVFKLSNLCGYGNVSDLWLGNDDNLENLSEAA